MSFVQVLTGSSALMVTSFLTFAKFEKNEKRRGWFLTLLTSCFVAPRSLYHLPYVFPFDSTAMLQSDAVADTNVAFFLAFLLCDTALGVAFYRSAFGLIEGWIHHCFYIVFFALTFYHGLTIGASTTFALEVPVIVLALGHVMPVARQDLLFGLLFFTFRVAYHAYLLYHWYFDMRLKLWPVILATLALHLHWFSKWIKGQRKRMTSKAM